MILLGKDLTYWIRLLRILETHNLENLDNLEAVLDHEKILTEKEIKQRIITKISKLLDTI